MEISLEIYLLIYFNKIRFELFPFTHILPKTMKYKAFLSNNFSEDFQHYLQRKTTNIHFCMG